jgi:hypothetical protein
MKRHKHRLKKRKQLNSNEYRGGLKKLKAEQDRPIFFHSTRNRIITANVTYYYSFFINQNAGIDSS